MNTYAKGKRIEALAKRHWEEKGFSVWQAKITRFGSNDFFGLFDLVCVKKGFPNLWIQVKANKCSKKVRDDILIFADEYFTSDKNIALVMVKPDRKEWKFYWIFGEGVRSPVYVDTMTDWEVGS